MNLDRFTILLVLCHLPLLWLPRDFLIFGVLAGSLIILWGMFRQKWLICLLGILLCTSYAQVNHIAKKSENLTASKGVVEFEVHKILKQTEYQTAIARLKTGETIYLNWQAEQPLALNQNYRAELNIRPLSSRLNIGNFDRQKWYFANHIDFIGTVRKAEVLEIPDTPFRTKWLNRVKLATENLPTQGLLLALAFGERAWLKTDDWMLFQQTATAHLIAISGLHIGLAMLFGFYVAKGGQWLCLKNKRLQAVGFSYLFTRIVGFLIALIYSYLAGFALPTLRALLAIAFVLVCQFFRRHYTPWQYWWRIVALLLILDPLVLLSDSFWLSILAVACLILWYQFFPLNDFLQRENGKKIAKFNRLCLSLLHLQVGIWLMFSPVQLYFFEGVSAFALVANLIIVPLYSFLLVPLILFSLITDNLFATWQLADYLAQFSLWGLEPLSHAWISLSDEQQWLWLSINILIVALLYCKIHRLTYRAWYWAMVFSGLFYVSFYIPKWLFQPQTEWIIFDVGQGLAMALIYEQNKAVIYDTGVSWKQSDGSVPSMAKLELLPYLKRNSIRVEAIFLSHDDNDHSGGMDDLLKTYPNAKFISSSRTAYQDRQPEPCVKGQQWQFGQWHLTATYPEKIVEKAKNQDSCVILAKNDRLQILLTGDSGAEQERQFASEVGKVDFLQVGHHGSKSSTSETLLASIQPQVAIISSGRWNPWRLPNKHVVERLERQNIKVFNTAETGMIRIKFKQANVKIEQARGEYSPWYRGFIK